MAIIDQSLSSLQQIRNKVRNLTRRLTEEVLTTDQLDTYINQSLLYDLPENIRHEYFKRVFTFYTQPYVDTYENITDDSQSTNPLYNFKNKYISFNPPAFVAGIPVSWLQSESALYAQYPKYQTIQNAGYSNGTAGPYTGNINLTLTGTTQGVVGMILKRSVIFSSITVNGIGIQLIDYPTATSNIIGALNPVGVFTDTTVGAAGQINYLTGAYSYTFPLTPVSGAPISSAVVLTQPSQPFVILFYDTKFTLRPVPAQVYEVKIEAYIRPMEFLDNAEQTPQLAEMWEYIAYMAAKKVLEDNSDLDGVNMILPGLIQAQDRVQRRTIQQQNTQRSYTMYANQLENPSGYAGGWNGVNRFF